MRVRLWCEYNWWVAQCLDVDIATQAGSRAELLLNIEEALRLHFQPPTASKQTSGAFGVPQADDCEELVLDLIQ